MENDIDKIDAFIREELSPEETERVKARLKSDAAFLALYEEATSLQDGIRYQTLTEKVKFLETLKAESQSKIKKEIKKETKIVSLKWLKYAAAACLLFLVGYFGHESGLFTNSPQEQYAHVFADDNFDDYIYHEIDRSTDSSPQYSEDQIRAYNLYTIQNFEKAIPLLSKLWEENKDLKAYYYLGVSYLGIGDVDKAKEILNDPVLKDYRKPF